MARIKLFPGDKIRQSRLSNITIIVHIYHGNLSDNEDVNTDGHPHPRRMDSSQFEAFPPQFGCIYYGPIPCFAGGAPHFAMVRTRRFEGFSGNTLALSPITSKQPDAAALKYCLELPHETLPVAYTAGTAIRKLSWILLPMTIRIPMAHLRGGMESIQRLRADLLDAAGILLDKLR